MMTHCVLELLDLHDIYFTNIFHYRCTNQLNIFWEARQVVLLKSQLQKAECCSCIRGGMILLYNTFNIEN